MNTIQQDRHKLQDIKKQCTTGNNLMMTTTKVTMERGILEDRELRDGLFL